jgi:hypothetical protein
MWKELKIMYILPKCIMDCKPIRRREAERPRKRWKDSCAGTGLIFDALKMVMTKMKIFRDSKCKFAIKLGMCFKIGFDSSS